MLNMLVAKCKLKRDIRSSAYTIHGQCPLVNTYQLFLLSKYSLSCNCRKMLKPCSSGRLQELDFIKIIKECSPVICRQCICVWLEILIFIWSEDSVTDACKQNHLKYHLWIPSISVCRDTNDEGAC